jgi:hypothetical protein
MSPHEIIEYRECKIKVSEWVDKWIINYIKVPSGTYHVKPFLCLEFPTRDAAIEKGKRVIDHSIQVSEQNAKPISKTMLDNL